MKKQEYSKPLCDCTRFDPSDIITSSNTWNGADYGGGNPEWGGTNGDDQIGGNWWDMP
ncbi:MAG: hypothetical protein Q4C01_01915 [Clostridia bacterium]|nr:hypothetical protein [Clostridia bacterium]